MLLATGEISIFWLVSEAEQTGSSVALSETLKTVFLELSPIRSLIANHKGI